MNIYIWQGIKNSFIDTAKIGEAGVKLSVICTQGLGNIGKGKAGVVIPELAFRKPTRKVQCRNSMSGARQFDQDFPKSLLNGQQK